MWWMPPSKGGSLVGASTGWGSIDDEETPEFQYWDVCDWLGHKVGSVPVATNDLGPRLDDLCMIPEFKERWGKYILMYRPQDKTYTLADGTVEFRLFPVAERPTLKPGWCKKCEAQGQFERTALICPMCRVVLGGF